MTFTYSPKFEKRNTIILPHSKSGCTLNTV